MQIKIDISGLDHVRKAMEEMPKKATYAAVKAMNTSLEWVETAVRKEMRQVFDRPTPWVLNSLRRKYAKPSNMVAELAFKDINSEVNARTMIFPHVDGGKRRYKAMEARLMGIGLMPSGYNAVPGGAAKLDANGNMSRGQISQLLNVLGTYTESGFNKAGINTVKRLSKGNQKKGVYGFMYWVNKVGSTKARHLQPGVYQRVKTGFGTSLKPILIFVKQANYKQRLDFYGITRRVFDQRFPGEFDRALEAEMSKTAAAIRTQS
jgi:hypothetical protein